MSKVSEAKTKGVPQRRKTKKIAEKIPRSVTPSTPFQAASLEEVSPIRPERDMCAKSCLLIIEP